MENCEMKCMSSERTEGVQVPRLELGTMYKNLVLPALNSN